MNTRIYIQWMTPAVNRIIIICDFRWFGVILHDFEWFLSLLGHSSGEVHQKAKIESKTSWNHWKWIKNSELTGKLHQKHECYAIHSRDDTCYQQNHGYVWFSVILGDVAGFWVIFKYHGTLGWSGQSQGWNSVKNDIKPLKIYKTQWINK